jgi:hypothetical protein
MSPEQQGDWVASDGEPLADNLRMSSIVSVGILIQRFLAQS